jgi:hypothetical protein
MNLKNKDGDPHKITQGVFEGMWIVQIVRADAPDYCVDSQFTKTRKAALKWTEGVIAGEVEGVTSDRYLFRGKAEQGMREFYPDWIIGDLSRSFDTGDWYIGDFINKRNVRIEPATIGQCTGLKDKNGKLIIEGDILWIEFKPDKFTKASVVFEKTEFCGRHKDGHYVALTFNNNEIIGSIHDSPSLLESGAAEAAGEAE